MADDNYLAPDTPTANQSVGTAADFGKTLGKGALDIGADLAANARYYFEQGQSPNAADISAGIQKLFNIGSDAVDDTINPKTKELAASTLTSKEFWDHPILASALKTTGMVPMVAAAAIPGGLLADAVAASAVAAGSNAALTSGAGLNEFYKKLDGMSDEELKDQSPKYKVLREVYDEKTARAKFNTEAQSWGPAINVVLGAASGLVGPAGSAARGLAGGKAVLGAGESGVLGKAALGATEGAVGGAAQTGGSDLVDQNTNINAHMQDQFDLARAGNKALEGGALGGLLGGAAGLVARGGAHADTAPAPKASDTDVVGATADSSSPQPDTGTATATPAKPVAKAEIGNPDSAPTRSSRDGAKPGGNPKTAAPKTAPEPAPIPLDPGVALAAGAAEPATSVSATEHAAITQGSPNETISKLNQGENGLSGSPEVAAPKNAGTALDTGQNTPEQPATLSAQIAQIGTGNRKAVMFPNGTVVPASAVPTGMKSVKTPRGRFIYDPKLTNAGEIQKLSRLGRENELLGLGPVSKPEAVARVAAGETPAAVTERTPDGTEVKAAAGTTGTVPEQRAALEATKTPGNVVAVETPENVLQMRQPGQASPPRTGRILPNLTTTAETTPLSDFNANKVVEAKEPQGKRYSEKEREALAEKLAKAELVTSKHVPDEREANYMRDPEARDAVIRRAQAMVEEAEKDGIKIQSQLKKSTKGDAASDHPSMQILRAAKDLTKVSAKRKAGREITEAAGKFAEAERLIRGGYSDEVLAQRRIEGDAKMKRAPSGDETSAATDVTPESELAAKEGAEVVSKEDATAVTSVGKGEVDKDAVKTTVRGSAKGDVRGVGDGTETIEGVTRAKAASGEKLTSDAKAKLIAEMNAKLKQGAPDKAPTKKQVEGEALRVERNPTEAQKAAGNYKKGHRRVEGLDYTIENPRGAIRRGVDEHGAPWEVRMPADYGYIRGTRGADGDHVDAYDLRSGKRHFVADQLDHKTGEFDEHKVILRANDEGHAVETYHKAFSDGHGEDRLGNLHEVTTDELKDWLKTGDTTEPHTAHALNRDMDKVNFDVPEGRSRKPVNAAAALDKIDFTGATGVNSVLGKFFQSRLKKLTGGVDVFHISPEQMEGLGHKGALGLHVRNVDTGRSEVYISKDALNNGMGTAYGEYGHVLMHELIHAATVREIESVPGANASIRKIARLVDRFIGDPLNYHDLQREFGSKLKYAFTNEKEFIAEAFSNPDFQEVLSRVPLDPDTAKYFGLHDGKSTVWDVFRNFVKKAIEKVTGKLPQFDSALDAMMRVGEHLTKIHEAENMHLTGDEPLKSRAETRERATKAVEGEALKMVDDAIDAVKKYVSHPENNTHASTPKMLKLRTFDNIAQIGDHFFGESNPVRKIHEAIEKMRVYGQKLFEKSEPIVRKGAMLEAKDKAGFAEFSSLAHDATVANVHPDVGLSDPKNAHLGKARVVGDAVWSKAQHPELAKRYNALSPELKEYWHESNRYYTDQQNKMSLGIIHNQVLKLFGHEDEALAKRVHEGTLTDADRATLGGNLDVIEKAGELSKIEGPYVPLMRRGDHVVKADIKVAQPSGAKLVSPNEFEYVSQKDAEAYAKSSKLRTTIKKVWVDEKTGELTQKDPATGKDHKMLESDLDSVARYRVEVQNRHVEFVQGKRKAYSRAAELAKDGSLDVHEVVPRAYEPGGRQGAELSTALSGLVKKLEKSDAYKQASPTQQATMRAAIDEAALASHGSTRVSSRALPRRGVAGYSESFVQNMVDYASSSSRYLAKLEHGNELESALTEMKETLDRDHSKTGQYARTAISNEVLDRVTGDNGFQQGGKLAPIVKRALSVSFIDKLGSPAYSVINAMQPAMVTMPYLSGRHGVGRAFAAMGKAYADINAARIVKEGLKETGRRIAGKRAPEDFLTSITKNLSPDEKAMIASHVEVGTLDPSAGMEIAELVRDTSGVGGKIDKGLGYLEGVTREMPRAIEAINRAVTAIAAYRLERSRGATHEAATQYSKDAVNNTQFNYSPTNSPAVFNHPLLKIALQFKKYGQGMYQLIGTQVANAIRNEKPGDRSSAVKTLIGIAATHTAIAGALGLPTEPFKYLLMGAHAAGLTGMTWSDVEDKIRHGAASVFGKTGGEVFSRGLPRLFNVDLSRAGLDSVTSFGEPKSSKEADVKSWLFDSVAGPVVSLGGDYIKALGQIANGDFEKAAENMIPLKAASDSLRAYRQYTEGKKSAAGKQTMTPYTPTEAALRVLGFGSGREAESGAANSAYYRQSAAQKDERGGLVNKWTSASPADKGKAWSAIQKFNQTAPAEVKITPKELTSKAKSDAKKSESSVRGISPNKRDKRFLAEGAIYNTGS